MKKYLFVIPVFISLVFIACSSQPTTVSVTLTEFGIQSSLTEFEAGKTYTFSITNTGALNHEFVLLPAGMPAMPMEGHDMGHDMAGALLHVGEDQLTPGASVTVEYVFDQAAGTGDLEFACHLPGHYEAGMFTPIVVEAS